MNKLKLLLSSILIIIGLVVAWLGFQMMTSAYNDFMEQRLITSLQDSQMELHDINESLRLEIKILNDSASRLEMQVQSNKLLWESKQSELDALKKELAPRN